MSYTYAIIYLQGNRRGSAWEFSPWDVLKWWGNIVHMLASSSKNHWLNHWLGVLFLSTLLHGLLISAVQGVSSKKQTLVQHAVKFKVAVAPKKIEEPKPEEKKIPPKQKRQPTPNTLEKPKSPPTTVPVQGLTKEALAGPGTISAPLGNTLMVEDQGKRLKEVDPLKGDMSSPAKLIANTLTAPPYTDEAIDAGLEGSFMVDVYVQMDGSVREAELRKKIGFGMDQRVINALKNAKFIPRKNKFGASEEGWAEIKFTLVIP